MRASRSCCRRQRVAVPFGAAQCRCERVVRALARVAFFPPARVLLALCVCLPASSAPLVVVVPPLLSLVSWRVACGDVLEGALRGTVGQAHRCRGTFRRPVPPRRACWPRAVLCAWLWHAVSSLSSRNFAVFPAPRASACLVHHGHQIRWADCAAVCRRVCRSLCLAQCCLSTSRARHV